MSDEQTEFAGNVIDLMEALKVSLDKAKHDTLVDQFRAEAKAFRERIAPSCSPDEVEELLWLCDPASAVCARCQHDEGSHDLLVDRCTERLGGNGPECECEQFVLSAPLAQPGAGSTGGAPTREKPVAWRGDSEVEDVIERFCWWIVPELDTGLIARGQVRRRLEELCEVVSRAPYVTVLPRASAQCPVCTRGDVHAHTVEDLERLRQMVVYLESKLGAASRVPSESPPAQQDKNF